MGPAPPPDRERDGACERLCDVCVCARARAPPPPRATVFIHCSGCSLYSSSYLVLLWLCYKACEKDVCVNCEAAVSVQPHRPACSSVLSETATADRWSWSLERMSTQRTILINV